jgi:hypothetical protein
VLDFLLENGFDVDRVYRTPRPPPASDFVSNRAGPGGPGSTAVRDQIESTLLTKAVTGHNLVMVNHLLLRGADPNKKIRTADSELSTLELALEAYFKTDKEWSIFAESWPPSDHSSKKITLNREQIGVLDRLIRARSRADVLPKGPVLLNLIRNDLQELLKFVLESKKPLDLDQTEGTSPLHEAVKIGDPDLVQQLIDLGAPVNAPDGKGKLPVFHAIDNNNPEIVRLIHK